MSRNKKNSADLAFILIEVIFTGLGLLFLMIGIVAFIFSRGEMNNATKIEATITDITHDRIGNVESNHVYVSYEFEGRQYDDVRINSYSSTMYEGKTIKVYVDNNNPGRIVSGSGDDIFFLAIFGGIGAIFAIIGISFIVVRAKGKGREKWLLENGRVLHGTVTEIGYNANVTVNGSNPLVVYCSYTDPGTGLIYQFKSRNIYENISACIAVGDSIDIYVDPNNYAKHYVDVDKPLERIISYV